MSEAAINQPARGNNVTGIERILSLPRVHVYRNAGLSILDSTPTIIEWDMEVEDNDGMWNPNYPTIIECRTAAVYAAVAWTNWPSVAGGIRQMRIRVNGGAKFDSPINYIRGPGDGSPDTGTTGPFNFKLGKGDWFELLVEQNTGGGLAFDGSTLMDMTNGFQAWCTSLP